MPGIALPTRGTVTEFHLGTGKIALEGGPVVKLRRSQCGGIDPVVGATYYVCELGTDPRFGGTEVTALMTPLAFELSGMLGIESVDQVTYDRVLSLGSESRARLARRIVEEIRHPEPEHIATALFTYLAEIEPSVFHEALDRLDPTRDPQHLAFRGAPLALLETYQRCLEDSTAPSAEASAAVIALTSSGDPRALTIVGEYLDRDDQLDELLLLTGYARSKGALLRWQYDVCYELDPVAPRQRTKAVMWRALDCACAACGEPLIGVLHIEASLIAGLRDGPPLDVTTCLGCITAVDAYFVRYTPAPTTVAVTLPEDHEPEAVTVEGPVYVLARGAPLLRGSWSDPSAGRGSFDRVGGGPTWLQSPRAFRCPDCDGVMMFVAQVTDVPGDLATFLFAFECLTCRIVATTVER